MFGDVVRAAWDRGNRLACGQPSQFPSLTEKHIPLTAGETPVE